MKLLKITATKVIQCKIDPKQLIINYLYQYKYQYYSNYKNNVVVLYGKKQGAFKTIYYFFYFTYS
jgi:hypothetical protein